MKWFEKIERKFGKYAIPNLMWYIIGIYIVGFVVNMFAPQVYAEYLALDVEKILQGQVWRIVTYIMQPPSSSILFMAFALYFYYMIGTVLERVWGAFRFNVYYFSGVLLHVIAAFLLYFIFGWNFSMTTYYINLALFMAFAVEYGDMEVLLFFILPIKIKWLAWFDGAIFAVTIIGGYAYRWIYALSPNFYMALAANGIILLPELATCALISMVNFLVFFFLYRKGPAKTETQRNYRKAYKTAQKAQKNREQAQRRGEQNQNSNPYHGGYGSDGYDGGDNGGNASSGKQMLRWGAGQQKTQHRCAVCGRTERDGDDLVFRFCSKCEGDREYCQDHLYTHIHVTGRNNPDNPVSR